MRAAGQGSLETSLPPEANDRSRPIAIGRENEEGFRNQAERRVKLGLQILVQL